VGLRPLIYKENVFAVGDSGGHIMLFVMIKKKKLLIPVLVLNFFIMHP
jgi:hypothetical protein